MMMTFRKKQILLMVSYVRLRKARHILFFLLRCGFISRKLKL